MADGPTARRTLSRRPTQRARRPKPAKLATHLRLRGRCRIGLSRTTVPSRSLRRLREDFPDDPEMWVSHETIYQSLYVQGRGGLQRELTRHLRTGRALRKPHAARPAERRGRLPGMVMISERPAEVEDRAVPGHWEGDLIIGSTASESAVGTLVERDHPVRDAAAPARRTHRRHRPGGDGRQDGRPARPAAPDPDLGPGHRDGQPRPDRRRHRAGRSTSATRTRPGNAAPTRTPTDCCASTSPRAPTCPSTDPASSTTSPPKLNSRPRKTLNWRTPAEALDALLSGQSDPPGVAPTD